MGWPHKKMVIPVSQNSKLEEISEEEGPWGSLGLQGRMLFWGNNNNNKLSVEKWNIRLILKTKQEVMQSQPIQIRRGIFQGDSLSPLHLHCTYSINKRAEQS